MFRIACNVENRDEMVGLMGEHKIQLGGYEWKIDIHGFGFCIGCKKEGHKISECNNKVGVQCFHCKEAGHVKSKCPIFEAELAKRREKSTCFKCSQKGHFGRECPNEALGWSMDPKSFPSLLVEKGQTDDKENEESDGENVGGLVGLFTKSKLAPFAQRGSLTQDDKRKAESPLSELDPKKTNLILGGGDDSELDASGMLDVSSEESEKVNVKMSEQNMESDEHDETGDK